MGILYGWQKEYLLEQMTFGQIIMYLNEGMRFKYPQSKQSTGNSLIGASGEEVRRQRDKLREQFGEDIEGL